MPAIGTSLPGHSAHRRQSRRLIIFAAVAVIVVLLIFFRLTSATPVRVTTVSRTRLRATLSATGFIESVQARVAPKISGRLVNIYVDENNHVRNGQLLAQLDSETAYAEAQAAQQAARMASAQSAGARHSVAATRRQAPGAIGQAQAMLEAARAQFQKLEAGSRPEEIAAAIANADQAAAAVQAARAQLQRAGTALEGQEAVVEAGIREAQALLNAARANEERIRSGSRPQEIAQAQASLRDASARAENAERELERFERLFRGGAISRQQVEGAQTALTSARAVETGARERLDLLRAGARPEELAAARADVTAAEARLQRARAGEREIQLRREEVNAARAQLSQAQASLRAATEQARLVRTGARQEDIAAARAKVREASSALSQATAWVEQLRVRESESAAAQAGARQAAARAKAITAQASETRLVAPFNGVVARRYLDPGDLVLPNTPVFLLVDLQRRWVAAEIDAEDLSKIHTGQMVNVTAEGYPGKVFQGRVREVAQVAEPKPGGRTRARIVRAKIDLLEPAPELRPGLEVDVQSRTTIRPGALIIPSDAVVLEDGRNYVFVFESNSARGIARRREIKVGAHTETETEVLSGLREGERIIVEGKEDLQDGARVAISP